MIAEQAVRTPKGQWVRVFGGWSPYQFAEKRMPTVAELNDAAPDTPVYVLFAYSEGLLNRAGVAALGWTPDSAPPEGGSFEFVDGGAILRKPAAAYTPIGKLPPLSAEDQVNSTQHFAPRVVVWSIEEVRAFVNAADHPKINRSELADAVVLALFSGQRQGDILSLSGASVSDGIIRLVQSKHGARVELPVIAPLAARLEAMNTRRLAHAWQSEALVIDSRTGRAFNAFTFRHRFADVRAIAAAGDDDLGLPPCPSLADKHFQDLRDTLITWLHRAGSDMKTIAGVSGHAMASIAQVLPHYIALGTHDAQTAMAKLTSWLDEKGIAV